MKKSLKEFGKSGDSEDKDSLISEIRGSEREMEFRYVAADPVEL
ncbi:hypothetical protein LEP1GSC137_0020, partial [Leptospira borgpetersenii str. Noumea 25]